MNKGFSGLPGGMQGLMKQAQDMQKKMQKIQEEAEQFTAEGSAGGGMVKVVANGKNEIVSIAIDPQVVNPAELVMLQDLIVAAANEGLRRVQGNLKDKLGAVTGGLNIPGIL
jgi:nucleoid-associated protein EbfC